MRWTIPRTEITIARLEEGPHAGEFLFTPETVKRIREFYMQVRDLPNRRQVPVENLYKIRQIAGGWLFPFSVKEGLPAWLQTIVFGQAAWKLLALGILLIVVLVVLGLVFRWSHRGPRYHHRAGFYFRRLVAPLSAIMLVYVIQYFLDIQANLTGAFADDAALFTAAEGGTRGQSR